MGPVRESREVYERMVTASLVALVAESTRPFLAVEAATVRGIRRRSAAPVRLTQSEPLYGSRLERGLCFCKTWRGAALRSAHAQNYGPNTRSALIR